MSRVLRSDCFGRFSPIPLFAVGLFVGGTIAVRDASAEVIDAESKVEEVTVFPDRALVTRRATLTLPQGAQTVRIGPLPAGLEPDSISARASGQAPSTLYGARLDTVQLAGSSSERVEELRKQLEQIGDRIRQLQNAKQVLQEEREFLSSIRAASSEQIGKELVTSQPDPAKVAGLVAVLDQQLTAIGDKDVQADQQLRAAGREADRLQRELQQSAGSPGQQQTMILVDLEAQQKGSVTIDVSYRVPGATWQPSYEARVAGEAAEVQLASYGVVRQQTGEDWTDVTLRLSTAKPAIGGRAPEIEPWWIRKYEPPVVAYRARATAMGMLKKAEAPAPEATAVSDAMNEPKDGRLEEAQVATAAAQTRGPAVVLTLPKRETIKSDWQPRRAALGQNRLPADFRYHVAPRLAPYAYLVATVKNGTDLTWLAGPVQVFLDNAFVATSSINVVGPGEEFQLSLGPDERIRVERRVQKAKEDISVLPGLHGRMKTIDYEYLTTVENFRGAAVHVTVIDQVPVSQHDDIQVGNVSFDPKPTEQDTEKPGVYRWKLDVPAGKKQRLTMAYRVRYPADFVVDGL